MSYTFADNEILLSTKNTSRTLVEILFYLHTFHLSSHSQTINLIARESTVFLKSIYL